MTPFEPDGVYAGTPYRVLPDSSIEAMMPGGLVKFKNIDQLMASAAGAPGVALGAHSIMPCDVFGNANANVPASTKPLDFYSILSEVIKKTEQNSAQRRALVYEWARFNLKRNIFFANSSMRLTDLVRNLTEFELAVARIETNAVEDQTSQAHRKNEPELVAASIELGAIDDHSVHQKKSKLYEPTGRSSSNAVQILAPKPIPPSVRINPIQLVENSQHDFQIDGVVPYVRFANQLIGILVLAIVFIGTVIVAGTLWHSPAVAPQLQTANKLPNAGGTTQSSLNEAKQSRPDEVKQNSPIEESAALKEDSPKVTFPLPTSYGIYVLSDNKLTELEALPISVPNSRVALSAEIRKPTTVTISDNKPAFILFRRDLLNNAPQKITLRIIARMARETKIVDGKAMVTNIEGAWRIRNISRELRVSPVPGQREMIIARPDDNNSLAAGRYAIVLNRVGYDFTIDGQVQSAEFCLEGFEMSNGSLFNQCRTP